MSNTIPTYHLRPYVRTSAQTGKAVSTPRGPFFACIQGVVYDEVSDTQITAFCQRMHGEAPASIER